MYFKKRGGARIALKQTDFYKVNGFKEVRICDFQKI